MQNGVPCRTSEKRPSNTTSSKHLWCVEHLMRPRGVTPEPQRSQLLAAAEFADVTTTRADKQLRHAVHAAHRAGGSVRHIAELLGRSTNTIQRWLKEGQ